MNKIIHPIFEDRPPDDAKLWRYLSISKLISLLESETLHFTRLDQYNDHFEGIWPKKDLEYWNKLQGFNVPSHTESLKRTKIAVSCWIENNYESAAMWQLYTPKQEGIAITSTFGKVIKELEKFSKSVGIDIINAGRVKYIDHLEDSLIEQKKDNTLWPFMLKNISYEHEKEVRAIFMANAQYDIKESGSYVPIDVNSFIEKIIISPTSENWLYEPIKNLLSRYGLDDKLSLSSLSKDKFYMKVIRTGT